MLALQNIPFLILTSNIVYGTDKLFLQRACELVWPFVCVGGQHKRLFVREPIPVDVTEASPQVCQQNIERLWELF